MPISFLILGTANVLAFSIVQGAERGAETRVQRPGCRNQGAEPGCRTRVQRVA